MIQGTGSDVGKSLLVAGLCRAFTRRSLRVLPFKPQNMSNNAAVTADGGEIGRAQALQARACGVEPRADMNPVLLKPQSETGSQVVVQGKVLTAATAKDYHALKPSLLPRVLESYRRLAAEADLVLVEGAGSAAEVNLRAADIANMGFAEAADLPVMLVGDIDRGGVIASIVGTHALLPEAERRRIRAYVINKFRGDPSLFLPACATMSERTGWACAGVLPWFEAAGALPAEDGASLRSGSNRDGAIRIAIPRLSRIANFDDFDPLAAEEDVSLTMLGPGQPIPGDCHLVILPGSKSTLADLAFLRAQGWDIDLQAHLRRGGRVLGICAGYQMLGRMVRDPQGIEGPPGEAPGLGLLDVETVIGGSKTLCRVDAADETGTAITAYEMHMGQTTGPGTGMPLLHLDGRPEGATARGGQVAGCYLHGLFTADGFRRRFLDSLRPGRTSSLAYQAQVETVLDALAEHCERHLDMPGLWRIAREGGMQARTS
ncbi:cobyric acid synthase [Telmatospirillum sp. J64-1]|uniref:cobyric acid synthase n=1 Tax=Telmatospirillum sp. J64-1 TaxID=2502183 RepID=UPI00115D045F|nr:cobyric acid synthase [Telmatospirillum sp. J64-1]